MPQSAVERFDLCGEGLSYVMLGVWNEIFVGLQHVRAIAHSRQVLDLMPWECLGGLHQRASEHLIIDAEVFANSSQPHFLSLIHI